MFVLCVVQKRQKEEVRTLKTKTQVRKRYKERREELQGGGGGGGGGGGEVLVGARFSAPVRIASGTHPAFYTMGTGFFRSKAAGA